MVKIQSDFPTELNRYLEIYKAKNGLKTKAQALRFLVDDARKREEGSQ